MKNKLKTGINAQFVFSEDDQVLINSDRNKDEWYPINFQWIPVVTLNQNM
ncbi:hypothetical protein MQE36_01445 [Zhouia spongiae]|uniref:Uncharacterized protein n=1 Tax=Zhouia spongiae TaxID=2202721 RepID=A0ABY3YN12_9FLAO|nr:hypothetical protein [Zhouia spongiae]UNY99028.1 hypothetical protein MQE36_01445 [Zhouia spongiae]